VHEAADASDDAFYLSKAFSWLRHCLRATSSRFLALADDDAFVVVHKVTRDLRAVVASGRRRVVYAAFEWFAYARNTGTANAWGAFPHPFGTAHAWRSQAGVPRALASTLCSNRSALLLLRSPTAQRSDFQPPFPLAKGTLVAWDRELVTPHGAHSALPPTPCSAQCPPSHAIQCPPSHAMHTVPSLPRHGVPSAH